jgi:hypothetical protein
MKFIDAQTKRFGPSSGKRISSFPTRTIDFNLSPAPHRERTMGDFSIHDIALPEEVKKKIVNQENRRI